MLRVAESPAGDTWQIIRPDGIGPAKVGMSLSQLNAALHEKFMMPKDKDERQCFYADSSKHPGISFMIEKGRLTRVDISDHDVQSAKGIRIGDSEAHTMAVYGHKLDIEPNAYTGPEDHVLTYSTADKKHGIRFIIDNGKVRIIYAGSSDSISYIEGCE